MAETVGKTDESLVSDVVSKAGIEHVPAARDAICRTALDLMTHRVRHFVLAKGWFEESRSRSVGDAMALIMTELAEVVEAHRDFHDYAEHYDIKLRFPCKNCGTLREKCYVPEGNRRCCEDCVLAGSDEMHADDGNLPAKPIGVPSELADILVRLIDTADAWGVDLYAAFSEKMDYNMTRPHQHGGRTL